MSVLTQNVCSVLQPAAPLGSGKQYVPLRGQQPASRTRSMRTHTIMQSDASLSICLAELRESARRLYAAERARGRRLSSASAAPHGPARRKRILAEPRKRARHLYKVGAGRARDLTLSSAAMQRAALPAGSAPSSADGQNLHRSPPDRHYAMECCGGAVAL
eukprot:CAMPEP_0171275816 /NCGR_PEP_ID=MMETSP0790-20130122/63518_1 /TAXON_ID=2925 /ORGANISM="Alexandrium catenella, Strain OF101" /LENGTH=160 /DNA_ID=CAMNT_0011744893 /DNA_START=195 /DNA_END=675 /DNA_ORIENTATION=+